MILPAALFSAVLALVSRSSLAAVDYEIPADFVMGAATAAYQIEGAWDEDGKGPSIWDTFAHETDRMQNTGDVTCDSYHKYLEDVEMLSYLGVNHYRFSLSWSRILPNGDLSVINPLGVNYYTKLIAALISRGIEPMITLYHWDLPQALEDIGGWLNPDMETHFVNYARLAFILYGNSVRTWFTFNEPKQVCHMGYGTGQVAPAIVSNGVGEYQCAKILLKAHAATYHMYDTQFREWQYGKISIVIDLHWIEPASDSAEDIAAADRFFQFNFGIYANPVYGANGDFPQVIKERVADRSEREGLPNSRLPTFTQAEIDYIKGTYDFFGLNTYTTFMARPKPEAPIGEPSRENDMAAETFNDPNWELQNGTLWPIVPWGIRKLLNYIHTNYGQAGIFITENGCSDRHGSLADEQRERYYKEYLSAILEAIYEDNVKMVGYTAWSLMDNLEWNYGFMFKFGLYQTNFDHPQRTRTIKSSGEYYKKVIETRLLNPSSASGLSATAFLVLLPILAYLHVII